MRNLFPLTLGLLIILMSGLIATSEASSLSEKLASSSGLPLLNAYASKHGSVKIRSDYYGYYVAVDFKYSYSDDSDTDNVVISSTTGAMMLGLYTSQTWLSNSCLNFNYYYCSINSCSQYTWSTTSENLPYFAATGYKASANAYLDYNGWYLSQNAAITTSCSGNSYYGQGRTGILGMGVGNNSYHNFKDQRKFSIYIERNAGTGIVGELTFDDDQNKKACPGDYGCTVTLAADTNWHVNLGFSAYMYFDGQWTSSLSLSNNYLIFDLASPSIGLPYSIYTSFVTSLSKAAGATCTSSLSSPTCYYIGYINKLPEIRLYVNSQLINIPPQVYVQSGFSYNNYTYLSSITLNIRALATNLSYNNYVTSDYSNYIILGSSFMTYYYTTFDNTSYSPQITLNVANPTLPGSGLLWLYITLGVLGLIAIIICCVRIAKGKKPNTGGKVVPGANTFDAPLITNAETGNYQYNQAPPAYDTSSYGNNYNQQTYGYN